jgi:membrane protease YdiL (CAAX protease family)
MAIYGVVALAVYLFAVRPAQGHWSQLGFGSFSWGWLFMAPVITLTMLFGMGLVNVLFVMPFTGGEFENPQIEALTGGSALSLAELGVLMILVAVVAPIVEELFFRGMLYPVLRRRWSAPVAIVVNGFLFALIHVIPILLPGLFFVGMVLGWVRERSGSVIPCMVIHALQNGTVLLVIYATLNGLIS